MKKKSQLEIVAYFILSIVVLLVTIPIILLIISSFTEENALLLNGYTLFVLDYLQQGCLVIYFPAAALLNYKLFTFIKK